MLISVWFFPKEKHFNIIMDCQLEQEDNEFTGGLVDI